MSKVEPVTRYRTADDKFFAKREDALAYQRALDFCTWYESAAGHPMSVYHEVARAAMLRDWLLSNRERVLELLGAQS